MDDAQLFLTDRFNGLSKGPLPVDLYADQALYEEQKRKIFARTWLHAGMGSQIPNPGDYFVKHVPTFDLSLIFVRDKQGAIRGFFNACSHRGTQLCNDSKGHTARFVCPYHNWTFDISGQLLGVPQSRAFFDLDKDSYGLRPVRMDTAGDFIFFTLNPNPEETLASFLGETAAVLETLGAERWSASANMVSDVKSNWILILDAGRESYHVFALHKHSGAPANTDADHIGFLVDAKDMGYHGKVAYWANPRYTPSKIEALIAQAAPDARGTAAGLTSGAGLSPLLNATRSKEWALDVFSIFPNLVITTNGQSMSLQQTWPTAAGRSLYEFGGYFTPPKNGAERFALEHSWVQVRDILSEDMSNLERLQRNYANGVVKEIMLGDWEVLLRHQHAAVTRWLQQH